MKTPLLVQVCLPLVSWSAQEGNRIHMGQCCCSHPLPGLIHTSCPPSLLLPPHSTPLSVELTFSSACRPVWALTPETTMPPQSALGQFCYGNHPCGVFRAGRHAALDCAKISYSAIYGIAHWKGYWQMFELQRKWSSIDLWDYGCSLLEVGTQFQILPGVLSCFLSFVLLSSNPENVLMVRTNVTCNLNSFQKLGSGLSTYWSSVSKESKYIFVSVNTVDVEKLWNTVYY